MAKKQTQEETTTSRDESKKQRKKQAKQEAKLMLKLEQAKKDAEKAQQKLAKAQHALESSQAQVHDLEQKLEQLRATNHEHDNGFVAQADREDLAQAQAETASQAVDSGDEYVPSEIATEEAAEQPAEGRDDLLEAQKQLEERPFEQQEAIEEAQIESGNGSMPIVTEDEHAWPPPEIREEIAEAVVEEATQEEQLASAEHTEQEAHSEHEELTEEEKQQSEENKRIHRGHDMRM